jgi:ABC-2 type transport system ATP-binding protein
MIKLECVTKKFKDDIILKDVSLEFEYGKIYGITGRNASGKSVFFKTICGFLEPDYGKILINGIDIYKEKCFPENTAALIEKPSFIDNLTGFENLMILARMKNKIDKKEVQDIINTVGISEKDQKKAYKTYSIGTKQKLGIAQVLMEDDKILIFDEPFSGLDDKTVKIIRELILKEKEKGKLILLSSHIKEDIDILCDIVYRIDGGKISECI